MADKQEQRKCARNYVLECVRDEKELKMLAEYAQDYAHTIGLCARHPEHRFDSTIAIPPPLALLPSPFPKELYEHAINVQKTLNELYFKVASDHEFLMESYKDVVKGDPFTARLVELAKRIHKEGVHQTLMVEVQRADYMSHWDKEDGKMELKQVEVNPGQIGGPGAATATSKLHRRMLEKVEALHGSPIPALKNAMLPKNKPASKMGAALYQAWKMFGDPNAVVLFFNQSDLFPVCHFEQLQFIQFAVEELASKEGTHVNVIRMSFTDAPKRIRLDEKDRTLYVDGNKKVGLVHMAYGYLPEHYLTDEEWNVRVTMERSTAIMSPNIRLQLSGTKKIQQVLAKPGVLEHFFPNQQERVDLLRQTFMHLYGLEGNDSSTKAVMQDAIKRTKNYVLKNQMDAGHGNFFDEALAEKLQSMDQVERGTYILQKKIFSITAQNYLVRPFKPLEKEEIISEVGIYGSLIADQKSGKIMWNSVDGHLCRSKPADFNEGGVNSGSGVIDSIVLFPSNEFQ